MNQTHSVPEIYNPDVSYSEKCKIVAQLCRALAAHKKISVSEMRNYLLEKVHVDFECLDGNPVGMYLLYEYIYGLRPESCSGTNKNVH